MTANKPRPIYIDWLPPCNTGCPTGQDVQKWLALTRQDRFREAWEVIMQHNPIPATIGRICYHPCEHTCNRYGFDTAVNINAVERFLGDMALDEGWTIKIQAEASGKRVLVVGAGAAGLAAAYHLRLAGHNVVICEASAIAGGMMHYGIPKYRLPRNILDAEIERIQAMGIEIIFNHRVEDLIAERDHGNFDAVFIAVGAPVGRTVEIPTQGSGCKVLDAVEFLAEIEFKQPPNMAGQKVVVYGGGNTAIDAARTAVRLGAKEIEIVYRRNRKKMPAYDFEVVEAAEEGVKLRLLRTIKEINGNDISLDIMELNEEGWPCPTDKTEIIQANVIILALGLNVDTGFLRSVDEIEFKSDSTVMVDDNLMTGCKGIFAGGDVIPYDRSVTTAIGHGKKAANRIDAYLREVEFVAAPKHEAAGCDKLHTGFYSKSDRKARSQLGFPGRKESFAEVMQGLNESEVLHESKRCFSCGNCFECDTCFNVCPVKAITKLGVGKGYNIDYDTCIRCGLCARKCPCGAIKMTAD